jgi:hypothetical protein
MIQPIALKRLRPGNVMVKNPPLNMNTRREFVSPKNVLQPFHTLSVKVNRYFTDVNGTLVDKADAGLIAAGMAVNYPVFVLGQWDKESGYKAGLNIVAPLVPYYLTFVNGFGMTSNQIVTPFSGLNTIQPLLKAGDIVQVYADSLTAPTYFAWIVISGSVSGMASVLANCSSRQKDNRLMRLNCFEINFIADFTLQLPEAWHFVHVDNLGNVKDNQITYNMFNDPFNVLPNVLTFPTEFEFNQYIGIYLYMVLGVDTMNFNFNFKITE